MRISNPWLPRVTRPLPNGLRLFCFPYAGGGASAFRGWADALGPEIVVLPIQLPGREARFLETAHTRHTALIPELARALEPHLCGPCAFFGHSLGALLAFELARALSAGPNFRLVRLFASGQRAPHLPSRHVPFHHLPDEGFMAELVRLGGTPADVLASRELLELLLPTLRADVELCETYAYAPSGSLPGAVSALGGLEDPDVNREELAAWGEHARGDFRMHLYPGDHFFVHQSRTGVLQTIRKQLLSDLAAAPAAHRAAPHRLAPAQAAAPGLSG